MQARQHSSNSEPPRTTATPVTDSPWFWVMLFAIFGLAALVAIGGKYGRRQAGIERKYQARERLQATDRPQPAEQRARDFATADDTLIPLWPIAIVLIVTALTAAWMLHRRRRPLLPAPRPPTPDPS